MNGRQLFNDDDAVSPVIGVILMVAITVILAAVIATFVLGLGEQISDTSPNASFSFDYNGSSVTITHSGGPNIDASQLNVSAGTVSTSWSGDVSAGDSTVVDVSSLSSGDRVSVIWENEEGTESSTLQTFTVP